MSLSLPTCGSFTASMISRPLSPLRNITFNRPSPATVSFFVSHVTRKPPLSP